MCARICQRDTDGDRVHRARVHSGRRGLDTRSAYFRDGVDDCRLRMLRAVCHRAYGRRRCGSDMLRGDSGFRYEEKKERGGSRAPYRERDSGDRSADRHAVRRTDVDRVDELSNQVQQLERFSRNKSCGVW